LTGYRLTCLYLTHGSETWTTLNRHKPKIRSVKMSYLTGVSGVIWRDRMMNEDLREKCGVDGDVLGSIRKNALRWMMRDL